MLLVPFSSIPFTFAKYKILIRSKLKLPVFYCDTLYVFSFLLKHSFAVLAGLL